MSTHRANRRTYDDTPDTDEAFVRLTALPDGPGRAALREELVNSWLPLSQRLAGRFRDHMWTLHVPRRVQELRNRVRTARHELHRPRVRQARAA